MDVEVKRRWWGVKTRKEKENGRKKRAAGVFYTPDFRRRSVGLAEKCCDAVGLLFGAFGIVRAMINLAR